MGKTRAYEYGLTILNKDESFERVKIDGAEDAIKYARQFYHEDIEIYESAFAMALNRSNRVIGWIKLSQGGVSSTSLPSEVIYKFAVELMASGIILVHNHPSGSAMPGSVDLKATEGLRNGLSTLNVSLLDHIILTSDSAYSFAEGGEVR